MNTQGWTRPRNNWLRSALQCVLVVLFLPAISGILQGQTATKILDNGADKDKLVFAIIGDGYTAAEQSKFQDDVSRLVVNGLLGHDFYKDNQKAFNVYRIDLVSTDSGVSTRTQTKNTALKTIYSGTWSDCWIQESPETNALIVQAISGLPRLPNYILVMTNEQGFGGCTRAKRLYVTSGETQFDYWAVVAHEYGHGIGGLYDEYTAGGGNYTGLPINDRNCSTLLNRSSVVWKASILSTTSVPTNLTDGLDENQTVGMFPGCSYKSRGIYRPVFSCRMNTNKPLFCPVCLALMKKKVDPYLADSPVGAKENQRGGESAVIPAITATNENIESSWISDSLFSTELSSFKDSNTESNVLTELDVTVAQNVEPRKTSPQTPASQESFIQMVIKVKKNGTYEVLLAKEVEGKITSQIEQASNYIYEVTNGDATLSVEFLPEDAFVERGFADPNNNRGEFLKEVDSAIIIVQIPKTDLVMSPQNKLGLQLYRVKRGTIIDGLDSATLTKLKAQKVLTTQFKFPANKLGPALREKINQQ